MANGSLPYFPFYPNDFASDGVVEAMTTEAVGAYILLLCKAWRESPPGTIPNDDSTLARWARLTPERWTECKLMVLAAFTLGTDNRYSQKRMRDEYDSLRELSSKRSSAGKNGASRRWNSDNSKRIAKLWQSHSKAIANASQGHSKSDSDSDKPPNPPPSGGREVGLSEESAEDCLQSAVKAYIAGHHALPVWSLRLQSNIERLVRAVGWEDARKRIDEAIALGKSDPPSWALGKLSRQERQEAAKDGAEPLRAEQVAAKYTEEY